MLEFILKDYVTLKTEVIVLKTQLYITGINTIYIYIYIYIKY